VILSLAPYALRPMREREDPVRFPLRAWIQRTALYDWSSRWLRRLDADDPVQRAVEIEMRADAYAPQHRELWDAARERLAGLHARCERDGRRLVLLATPLLADVVALPRAENAAPLEVWSREREHVTWIDASAELRGAMQDLLQEIAARGLAVDAVWDRARGPDAAELAHAGESVFFLDDPWHLTERGHQQLARSVDAALVRAGLIR
jgi:hypothetical protein